MLGAGVMFVVGGLDDLIDVSPPAKVAGQVVSREPARVLRRHDVLLPGAVQPLPSRHRGARVAPRAARDRAVGRVDGQRDQPHRRARRTGRRASSRSAAARSSCSPTGCSSRTTSTDRTSARSSRSSRSACASASSRSTWHPAKIIMGDAGALFLGVLLAVPTITIGGRTDHAFSGNTYFFFAPLLIPRAHLRRADRRHGVLVSPAHGPSPERGTRPTPGTSTTG